MDNIETYQSKLKQIADKLSSSEINKNPLELKQLTEEYNKVSNIIKLLSEITALDNNLSQAKALVDDNDPSISKLATEESEEIQTSLNQTKLSLNDLLKPKDKNDSRNVILEIRAGSGGTEAALFAGDLFRMYSKYSERKGFKVEILSSHQLSEGGFKEIIANLKGHEVYKVLKFESGVHRVQRIPATESSGRIHTSAASVVILPEAEDIEIAIDPNDLIVDTFRAGGPGGQSVNTTDSAIRITHIPTSLVVSCQDEKSQHKNKAKAMKILKSRLFDLEMQKLAGNKDELRRNAIKTGNRSSKIRTYNFPQNRVTDHRIHKSWYNLESILNGNIDEIISSLQEKL